jgi:D-alanyl-D-alanine carboxypeptidase (penicillin-binding protein 5/6)
MDMLRTLRLAALCFSFAVLIVLWSTGEPKASYICARSAILINAADGQVLYEQNADSLIPPASVTKILTLYLVFDAMKKGQVHPGDMVKVSRRAANTSGSRMGLRTGKDVPLEEVIKGIAVVSGNDAAVAVAEHLSGNVDNFVSKMNIKARELGMTNSHFMTPNGLPAKDQLTTARDLAKLSLSYLQHYPESLQIHSMTSYAYNSASHHNANRLLGTCPGVDGIKTGFVCASGFNLSATAKRADVRLIAVVLGARAPSVRTVETEKLLEAGFQKMASDLKDGGTVEEILAKQQSSGNGKHSRLACAPPTPAGDGSTGSPKRSKATKKSAGNVRGGTQKLSDSKLSKKNKPAKKAADSEPSSSLSKQSKTTTAGNPQKAQVNVQALPSQKASPKQRPENLGRNAAQNKPSTAFELITPKRPGSVKKPDEEDKPSSVKVAKRPSNGNKQKIPPEPVKKTDKKP